MFNPTSQAIKFDPDGGYVRTWVPELALLGAPAIHEPSAADSADLDAAGITLGKTYPLPIVDHGEARLRTLETYKRALKSLDGRRHDLVPSRHAVEPVLLSTMRATGQRFASNLYEQLGLDPATVSVIEVPEP